MEFKHESVLLSEAVSGLNIRPDGIYVDGTLGGGGHSFKIVQRLKGGRLIGLDRDKEAVWAASKRLSIFADKITLLNENYINTGAVLKSLGIGGADGILLDLGVSSYQIDNPERGFSYKTDAPLDMRMDTDSALTAKDVVNTYPREELARIIREYGEESFANNIAKHIEEKRKTHQIETTGELFDIIEGAIPAKVRGHGIGFAAKTFQAIRIEVNSELDILAQSVGEMISLLNPGGRLCIITFHSLEDRIVKNEFKKAENPCTCPPNFPVCACGAVPLGKIITKKPITPGTEETERNKRSQSAKLRIFEKN